MPRTTSRVNKGAQTKATAAAKRARLEEAGLRGPRLGRISSAKRRAQARRDAKSDAATTPAKAAKGESTARPAASSGGAAKKPSPGANAKSRKRRASPLIEVRTDSSVKGSAGLDAFAEEVVTGALSRFLPRVTRIDIHLSDVNAGKTGGHDKHCQIEVRPATEQPVSTTAAAGTIEQALTGAANKMKRLLATRFGRARTRGGGRGRA